MLVAALRLWNKCLDSIVCVWQIFWKTNLSTKTTRGSSYGKVRRKRVTLNVKPTLADLRKRTGRLFPQAVTESLQWPWPISYVFEETSNQFIYFFIDDLNYHSDDIIEIISRSSSSVMFIKASQSLTCSFSQCSCRSSGEPSAVWNTSSPVSIPPDCLPLEDFSEDLTGECRNNIQTYSTN